MRRAIRPRIHTLVVVTVALAGCSGSPAPTTTHAPAPTPRLELPATAWPAEKQALHVLNRLAYGPRPGDAERVAKEGVGPWILRQMRPSAIPDAAVEAKLKALPTLTMSIAELQKEYPRPKPLAAAGGGDRTGRRALRDDVDPARLPRHIARELTAQKLIRAAESERQLLEVLTDFWFNHLNVFVEKGEDRWMVTAYERDAIRPHVFGSFRDLLGATARHPAMLWYLDNWASTRDGVTRAELVAEERGGRRAGRRAGARVALRGDAAAGARGREKLGLNENYARELLELHTLGVDGGYIQDDVREVARCFTGWSIERPREAGTFRYRDAAHDRGQKVVLGHVIPAGGGIEDGEKVLDLLAGQPATARFIARKLCRKLVSDAPPDALVARVAAVFQRTRGDLPSVYAAILSSPEFWSDETFGAKTKTPLELAASALRALDGRTTGAPPLAEQVGKMGEPLYRCQPPTGYKETADAWVSTGALLNRLNFGLALAAGRVGGTRVALDRFVAGIDRTDAGAVVDRLAANLLPIPLGAPTRDTILAGLSAGEAEKVDGERRPVPLEKVAGLLLGSPEFQKQ